MQAKVTVVKRPNTRRDVKSLCSSSFLLFYLNVENSRKTFFFCFHIPCIAGEGEEEWESGEWQQWEKAPRRMRRKKIKMGKREGEIRARVLFGSGLDWESKNWPLHVFYTFTVSRGGKKCWRAEFDVFLRKRFSQLKSSHPIPCIRERPPHHMRGRSRSRQSLIRRIFKV